MSADQAESSALMLRNRPFRGLTSMGSNGTDGSGRNTDNLRKAAAASAANRTCPGCGRKAATWRERIAGVTYYGCRWCDWTDTRG